MFMFVMKRFYTTVANLMESNVRTSLSVIMPLEDSEISFHFFFITVLSGQLECTRD